MTLAAEKQDEKAVPLPAGAALDSDGLPVNLPDASAVRFLNQATFGATPADIASVSSRWRDGWIQDQVALPITQTNWDRVRALQTAWFNGQSNPATADPIGLPYELLDASLWSSFVASPDQLRKRVAYALSQIMVVSMEGLGGNGYQNALLSAGYFDVLEKNAFGNYRNLLKDIALNPARTSHAKSCSCSRSGWCSSISTAATRLAATAADLETYTTDDVMGLARVFTGWNWEFDSRDGSTSKTGSPGGNSLPDGIPRGVNSVFCECYRNPMVMVESDHSPEVKSFLSTTIPAGTKGAPSLETAIDTLFNHPNVGPFIGRQLIQRLVTSNLSPAYITRVAQVFNDNGSGVRGDLKAVISQILRDPEARTPLNITAPVAGWGKVREPVLRFTGVARLLGLNQSGLTWSGTKAMNRSDPATQLSQSPLRSPSVFNFYRPGYVPPNSKVADAGLVAPEMQITTETAVPGTVNYLQGFITGGAPKTAGTALIDFTPWLTQAAQAGPSALVADLNLKLANGALTANTQSTIKSALGSTAVNGTAAQKTRIQAAMLMILSAPEYVIQK